MVKLKLNHSYLAADLDEAFKMDELDRYGDAFLPKDISKVIALYLGFVSCRFCGANVPSHLLCSLDGYVPYQLHPPKEDGMCQRCFEIRIEALLNERIRDKALSTDERLFVVEFGLFFRLDFMPYLNLEGVRLLVCDFCFNVERFCIHYSLKQKENNTVVGWRMVLSVRKMVTMSEALIFEDE